METSLHEGACPPNNDNERSIPYHCQERSVQTNPSLRSTGDLLDCPTRQDVAEPRGGAMKFGKVLRQTVDSRMPQWREYMIDYKTLKQALKKQLNEGTHGA